MGCRRSRDTSRRQALYIGRSTCSAGRSAPTPCERASPGSRACALDRCGQSVRYDKAILVGNGHTCRGAGSRGPELIALCRPSASVEVAGRRRGHPAMAVDLVRCKEPFAVREAGMAQKVIVALEDDLDGGPADETVRFGIDGAAYEIDLSKKN
ncbi:MAG: Lsr2 dimerization domain-containing protein, partial [Streptosporangiaceae bacterium]